MPFRVPGHLLSTGFAKMKQKRLQSGGKDRGPGDNSGILLVIEIWVDIMEVEKRGT